MKFNTLKFVLITLLFLSFQSVFSQPWATSTVEKRANTLLKQMTLDEKLAYIGGDKDFYIREIKRLGIPEIKMSDGPQGLRNDGKTNAMPCGILLAATWNKNLAEDYGKALGKDAKARGVHILLGPGVNIYRSPLCGRNFEYFGEDPYLTSKTALNYINGVQLEGVVATIKHFAANNQEWDRNKISSDVDVRTLHEIYLPAFETAVKQGNVGAVMSSYNLLNGTYTSENRWLLSYVLRKQWGFRGILMSDWVSTYNAMNNVNNGLDLEMPSAKSMNVDSLHILLKSGKIKLATIDQKVLRILRTIIGFGFMDKQHLDKTIPLDNPKSALTALNVAREGLVLLKNDNQILPIDKNKVKKIMVFGPNASTFQTGGGSGVLDPFRYVSTLEGIKKIAAEKNIEVVTIDLFSAAPNEFFTDKNSTKQGLKAQFFNNKELKGASVAERIDTAINFNWSTGTGIANLNKENASIRWTGIIRPSKTNTYNFMLAGDDGFRLYIDGKKVCEKWSDGATTVKNTRIKLESNTDHEICIEYYQGTGGADFLVKTTIENDAEFEKNCADVDLIIACFGFNAYSEMEGQDREFGLSDAQTQLIKDLSKTNKPVVGVVNAGGNVEMHSWYPSLAGLLWAWYPGQEGGTAIAEILFGKVNPSGKLPATFEKRWEDNPTFNSYYDTDNDKRVKYTEGIFVGYRGYDKNKTEVQFPFGYGLSYSKFELSDLNVQQSKAKTAKVIVTCRIKNISTVEGAEVVQLYIGGKHTKNQEQPIKELKGYEKMKLKAGETQTVSFEVSARELSYFSVAKNKFLFDAGIYHFMIGTSSRDIKLEQKMAVK